jgi:hypothetical protein
MNQNPKWYQRLCLKVDAKRGPGMKRRGHRKHDTGIRRCRIERSLERLSEGKPPSTANDFRVLPIVRAAATC